MQMSRRELGVLVPILAAAQTTSASPPVARQRLSASKMYHHADVPYSGDDTKKGRRFLLGETHGGFTVEAHETILGPGIETHQPHQHVHEEIIVVVEGTVETWVDGKTEVVEPGSVIWFGSNQMHSARNVGRVPSRYYVIELRGGEA